jgi:Amt family ammonium transporter
MDKSLIDVLWVTVCAVLVFLMQAGFLCLEAGSSRSKNNINVAIKNIADFGVSVLCFWLFGYGLMFGQSHNGWIGVSAFFPEIGQGEVWMVAFFLFQAMFCGTAVTIVSGAVAERMRFNSYLLICVLLSGLVYPIFGHWSWNGINANGPAGWLEALGFVDFAGSTVVHSIGGWVSLACVIILGPRIGRFSSKRRRPFMYGFDLTLAVVGALLLWLGWFGFNGGSALALNEQVPGIITNTLLAGCAGLAAPIGLSLFRGERVPVTAVMNGSLAGLVAITANCHVVTAGIAILIGAIGSLCMVLVEKLLEKFQIDDVVGAIPVHLGAGIWGTLAVALFGDLDLIGTGLDRHAQLMVQLLGISTAGLWSFGVIYVVLRLVNLHWPIRVPRKHEYIGLNVAEHGAVSDLVDLFKVMRQQERTGDLKLRAPVELFTPVGQIAARYNRVISALEQSLARTDAIVETATEAIITISKRGLLVRSANPAVRKLFGVSEKQICGQPLMALADMAAEPQAGEDAIARLQRFLEEASQDANPYELLGKRRSGGTFPVEVTVSLLKTRQEDTYSLILRDITLRRQAEEAIQASEAKDVKTRKLEKALKDLQQAQIQLVHSEKMSSLGQLVAGVAHEINNPINFIYANLTYVEEYVKNLLDLVFFYRSDGSKDAPKAERPRIKAADLDYMMDDLPKVLSSMRVGAERITEIVQSLRDFSHVGSGQIKRVDIHQGLESTLTILGGRLKARGDRPEIKVIRDFGELPRVECYPGQLNQVFMNLLTNAIDALEEKAIALASYPKSEDGKDYVPQIILRTEWGGGASVQIHVTDNGVGIPENVKRRMLDPFFTTKPVGKGTGLGMSISYQIIVERHRGKLRCLSTPGQGTRFLIELPVDQTTKPTELV